MREPTIPRPSPRAARWLFLGVLLALCAWHVETARNDGTVSRVLAVRALAERGSLEITPWHAHTGDKALRDGRYYSDKAPLPTFAVAALWKGLLLLGLQPSDDPADPRILLIGGFLFGSVPMALLLLLAYREARRAGAPDALLLGLLPLLGSFLFVFSGTFFNHLPAALFAVLAACALRDGRAGRTGLFAGLAVACDAALLFGAAAWLAIVLARQRPALGAFALGLVPGAAATMANNAAVGGSPFTFPSAYAVNYGVMREGYGFGHWVPEAFLGLTISPYRGLLFYAPALIGVLALAWARRRALRRPAAWLDPFVLPALLIALPFFTHATWWGGWSYGPRYLTAVPALLLMRALPGLARSPAIARGTLWLSAFGLLCAVAARLTTGYALPTGTRDPLVELVWPLTRAKAFHGAGWPLLAGFSPAMGAALFCCALLAAYFALRRLERAL